MCHLARECKGKKAVDIAQKKNLYQDIQSTEFEKDFAAITHSGQLKLLPDRQSLRNDRIIGDYPSVIYLTRTAHTQQQLCPALRCVQCNQRVTSTMS